MSRHLWLWRVALAALAIAALTPSAHALIIQRAGDNYVAFEAEDYDSMGGTQWRVIDLTTPYSHPNTTPVAGAPVTSPLLPAGSNASGGAALLQDFAESGPSGTGIVVYKIDFATAGAYRFYIRQSVFQDGHATGYGNEDSLHCPSDFDLDPTVAYHSGASYTEGTYGWRNDYTYTVSSPGTVEFRIKHRETGQSLDRIVFSQTTGLGSSTLDGLFNYDVVVTHAQASGAWATAANWDNGTPDAAKPALIGDGRTITLASAGSAAHDLTIGHDGAVLPGDGTLNQTGGDLTIGGDLNIGINSTGAADVTGTCTATGGSLTVGSPTDRANITVGKLGATTDTDATGTLELGGATQFTAYLDTFTIGLRSTANPGTGTAAGQVTLAQSNLIDARQILISDSHMYSTVATSNFHLGTANTIQTDLLRVGGFRGQARLDFASGGTLDLTGSTGAAADLRIGDCWADTGSETRGVMDLTGGTFNATLGELLIGHDAGKPGGVGGTGTLTFEAGTVTANSVVIGDAQTTGSGDGDGNGTLNMNGGTLTVATDLSLGTGTVLANGTVNQTAGTLTVNGNVVNGLGAGTLNIDGGTMHVAGDLDVDTLRVGYEGKTGSLTVGSAGVGDVTIGASGDLYIGRRVSSLNALTEGTLDVSATNSFVADLDSLVIASLTHNTGSGDVNGTLTLGPNNTINANTIQLGHIDGGNVQPLNGIINLGASNTINADTFIVGSHKGTGNVSFTAGGTLDLSGNTGAKTDLRIGDNSDSPTSSTASGHVDLSGGTFIATLGQLVIGDYASDVGGTPTGSGSGIGSLTLGDSAANNVQVDSVLLANYNANATTGSGTKTVSGTITMGGGQFQVAGDLVRGVNNGVANGATATSTLYIDGGTLDVTGDLKVDTLRVGYDGRTATVTAGGDVEIGASGNLEIGLRDNTASGTTRGTLDLSSADSVTIVLDNLRIGTVVADSPGNTYGTLSLSTTGPNTISATEITLGHSLAGQTPTALGTIHLGADNVIEANTVYVGRRKAQGEVDIVSGGTLTLTGPGGTKATLRVGYNDTASGSAAPRGKLDLSGGTLNATLGELTIGYHPYPWSGSTGKVEAEMTFDAGTVTADTVTIGKGEPPQGSAVAGGGGIGTLNVNGGALVAQSILLGVGGSDRAHGTLNLSGGTLTAGLIDDGSGTAVFNWTGGTLQIGTFGFTLEQNGGTLAPGTSPGYARIDGDYLLNDGILQIEANDAADQGDLLPQPPPNDNNIGYDYLEVTGTAMLDGVLEFALLGGYAPALGTYFDVVSASEITIGDNFALDQSGAGLPTAANTFAWSVVREGNREFLRLGVVPEPTTCMLLALGIAPLLRRRRKA